ncbi:MAG: sorbosone dehydrogenase family protein, partial [Methylophilaceae bacterium]|nr:sorbosone dehydrogenase family protein [Methylophilaceae bacterium]
MYKRFSAVSITLALLSFSACSQEAKLPISAGMGPNPTLPPPYQSIFPTLNIAPAIGWPVDGKPEAATGTTVAPFMRNLDHPRWLYVLPNGDVLVAETNAPPKPDDGNGIKG